MPSFITEPVPQPYPPVTIPLLAPGIPGYMIGFRNDYRYGVGVIVPELISAIAGGLSLEFAIPSYAGSNSNAPALQWILTYPTAPASINVLLEGAVDAVNGPWVQLAVSTNVGGDSATILLGSTKVNFVRTNITAVTGTAPTCVSLVML